MADEYPDEETLKEIETWPVTDPHGALERMRLEWSYPDRAHHDGRGGYRFSTGGWSGNEELIGALESNVVVWMTCWQLSRRGGHFEFQVPESFIRK